MLFCIYSTGGKAYMSVAAGEIDNADSFLLEKKKLFPKLRFRFHFIPLLMGEANVS